MGFLKEIQEGKEKTKKIKKYELSISLSRVRRKKLIVLTLIKDNII